MSELSSIALGVAIACAVIVVAVVLIIVVTCFKDGGRARSSSNNRGHGSSSSAAAPAQTQDLPVVAFKSDADGSVHTTLDGSKHQADSGSPDASPGQTFGSHSPQQQHQQHDEGGTRQLPSAPYSTDLTTPTSQEQELFYQSQHHPDSAATNSNDLMSSFQPPGRAGVYDNPAISTDQVYTELEDDTGGTANTDYDRLKTHYTTTAKENDSRDSQSDTQQHYLPLQKPRGEETLPASRQTQNPRDVEVVEDEENTAEAQNYFVLEEQENNPDEANRDQPADYFVLEEQTKHNEDKEASNDYFVLEKEEAIRDESGQGNDLLCS